jgi:zinc protease
MKTRLLLQLVIFSSFTFISFSSYADILNIQTVTSPKGIKAWLVEDKTIPVISLRFMFKGAGAINDPEDMQGLSQVLSNTLDEGAGEYDSQAFQAQLNDKSISLSFSSSRDDFGGHLKTLTKYQDTAFNLLSLAITKPRFDKEPVARMIDSNLVRIRSNMTDPEWMNARLTNDVLYRGHPYAANIGGTLSSLPKITPDDLRSKYSTQFALDNLVVAVSGNINAEELGKILDKIFGQLPSTSKLRKIDTVIQQDVSSVTLYKQDIPQTVISMAVEGIRHDDPEYHAAEVMDFVLGSSGFGSRLTEEVREKRGLTYGIYSGLSEMNYSTLLSIGSSTKNETVKDVINLTKEVMNKLASEPISPKELKDAKAYLIGSVPLSLTSSDRISGMMIGLMAEGLPPNYLDERAKKIENIDESEILLVSKRLLKTDQMKIILVGNPEIGDNYISASSLPNVE